MTYRHLHVPFYIKDGTVTRYVCTHTLVVHALRVLLLLHVRIKSTKLCLPVPGTHVPTVVRV